MNNKELYKLHKSKWINPVFRRDPVYSEKPQCRLPREMLLPLNRELDTVGGGWASFCLPGLVISQKAEGSVAHVTSNWLRLIRL